MELGIKMTPSDAESLWEDLTDAGRSPLLDTAAILAKFSVQESILSFLCDIPPAVIQANEELYKMHVPKCSVGYLPD